MRKLFSLRSRIFLLIPLSLLILVVGSWGLLSLPLPFGRTTARTERTWFVCPYREYRYSCDYYGAPGIQKAIDNAESGDRITLTAGTYYFSGTPTQSYVDTYRNRPEQYRHFTIPTPLIVAHKNITLQGDPHESTKIDFGGSEYGLVMANAGGSTIRYLHFTGIRSNRGATNPEGGAIVVRSLQRGNPVVITAVAIKNDYYQGRRDKTTSWAHGIVVKDYGSVEINNSLLYNNTGSGVLGFDYSSVTIYNSLLLGNNDGVQSSNFGQLFVTNSVIADNTGRNSARATPSGLICGEEAQCSVRYSIFNNNKNGHTYEWNGGTIEIGPGVYYQSPQFRFRSRANKELWRSYDQGTFPYRGDPSVNNPDGSRSWIGLFAGRKACAIDDHNPGCSAVTIPQPHPTSTPQPTSTPRPSATPTPSQRVWNVCKTGCAYPGNEGLEQAWSAARSKDMIRIEPGTYRITTPELASFADFTQNIYPGHLFVLASKGIYLEGSKDTSYVHIEKRGDTVDIQTVK